MRFGPRSGLLVLSILIAGEATAAEDALRSSVVRIEVDKLVTRPTTGGNFRTERETYVGSGFWVSGTRRIVTCAHVLEGSRRVSVSRFGAPPSQKPWSTDLKQVTRCLSDPQHDLAVIEVPEVGLGFPLTTSAIPAQAPVRSMGHTENYPWRLNEGQFTGTVPAQQINTPLEGQVMVCDISVGPGSSGGVVVDRDNRIIGMIQGGSARGVYGTKILIPAAEIHQALQALSGGAPCRGGGLTTVGTAIMANENKFEGLLRVVRTEADEFPARYWGQGAYGFVMGADRFDDTVPALQLEIVRPATDSRSWSLRVESASRKIDRTLAAGTQEIADDARMQRLSVTFGPRVLLKEFGRVSIYSTAAAGYVRDRVTHAYTFASPLFAPQSHERSVSGFLSELALDADVPIVLKLRLGLSTEVWQGSGGIGNGVTHHVGLRVGVGRGRS